MSSQGFMRRRIGSWTWPRVGRRPPKSHGTSARTLASAAPTSARQENLRDLENRISAADTEISGTYQELQDLRAKVVRISIDSENPARANDLNASLDGLNARLEALGELMTPQEES